MTTYLITDATGYEITRASDQDVAQLAQASADRRGETVTVTPYHMEDGERIDDEAEEYTVEPTAEGWTDNPLREEV